MKARTFILLAAGLVSTSVSAQGRLIDSLDQRIAESKTEEERLERLWEAASTSYSEDKEATVRYTSRLLQEVAIQSDSARFMEVLCKQAAANRWLGNYVVSIDEFKACYDYFKQHADTTNWSFSANYLGSMHVFMGYNEAAQSYLNEVYRLQKERGNPVEIARATNGLAIFYSNINQNEKAKERYEEALHIFESVDDTLGRANVHANLGLLLIDMGDYSEAEFHLRQQGHLDTLLNTQWGLGFHFDFMGYLRRKQGRLEEALENHRTALGIREQLESHYNISESRSHLCNILIEMERYKEALEQANLILASADLHNSLSHQQTAYLTRSQAWEGLGNFEEGLRNHKVYKSLSDSILNQDILEKVAEKDAKFDLANQRHQVELLDAQNQASEAIIRQKNRTIWLGGGALLLFALLSLALYRLARTYLRQRKELSVALSDKELLLKEIHHRVKNNLQIVSSLLSLQSRSVHDADVLQAINEGKSRVRSMALIHQNLYQGSDLTGVEVKPYLEKLCQELFHTYKVDSDEVDLLLDIDAIQLDVDTLVPLGLIMNELITNSLKHAFVKDTERASGVTLRQELALALKKDRGALLLTVSDTGEGFIPGDQAKSEGFGQKLLRSLSAQLGGQLEVVSGPEGTRCSLRITKFKLV